jgi:putative peptidoglycan lipid II flippase
MTALALQAYAIGLAGYAAIKVLTPCFYALNLPRTPLRISLIGIAVNLVLNVLNARVFGLGHAGLALATSGVAVANFGQLCAALSKQVNFGGLWEWLGFLGRVLLASAASGAVAWGFYLLFEHSFGSGLLRAAGLIVAIGAAMATYAGAAWLLRIRETTEFIGVIRRRLGRKSAAA